MKYVQGAFSIASMLGSLFIIGSIIFLKRTTKTHGRCLLSLAACQLALSLTYLVTSGFSTVTIDTLNHPIMCKLQGISIQYFNLASWIWTSCIAWNMWAQIVCGYSGEKIVRAEKYMHLIAWLLPAVTCGLVYKDIDAGDGLDLQWCWAGSSTSYFVLFSFDVPLLVVLMVNITLISWIVYYVFSKFSADEEVLNPIISTRSASKVKTFSRRILFYPIVLIVCYSGAFVNQVFLYWNRPLDKGDILLSFMFLDGFLTAIVYSASSSLISVYKHRWKEWKRTQDGLEFTNSRKSINEFIYP
jgi:hypothetical protein